VNILITGGAGYIGSHVAKQLLEMTSYKITVVDNLSTGSKESIKTLQNIRAFDFIKLDLKEFKEVDTLLKNGNFDTVMHFAASIVVPESISDPLKYYMNNTVNTTNLIKYSVKNRIKRFIFSSTAAVYGQPEDIPTDGIGEDYPTNPINPYGMSKLMSERVLQDTADAYEEFKYVIFRYFNVAGADISYDRDRLSPRIGQSFPDATHLIKIASECAVEKRDRMAIFGEDYDTHDGTGVRDYIHVDDLAYAHVKAVEYLKDNKSDIFNVGYSKGYSVKEIISHMKEVTQKEFIVDIEPRRAGDPAMLVANSSKIKQKMQWTPKYEDISLICQSAYMWESR
jgi:UDP-glucose 4-epimerase